MDCASERDSGPGPEPRPAAAACPAHPGGHGCTGGLGAGCGVRYQTNDTQNPLWREVQIFYYRTKAGDLYELTVGYPGKGDFTARGREVAKAAIANLDIKKL